MLTYFLTVAGQVITLFLMMGVGFFLGRKKKLTSAGVSQMTFILLYVVAPCIIVESLQTDCDPVLLADLGIGALVMTGLYVVYALVAARFFRRQPENTRATLQFGLVYGNTGFMGIPLVAAMFGDKALIFAALCFVFFTVFSWIHGVAVMGSRAAVSVRKIFLNPGVIPVAIGLPLFLMSVRLPSVVGNAVSFIADINTPLAMLVIGFQMSGADLPNTFRRPALYVSASVRLLLMPAITAVLLLPLGLNPLMYATMVILAATPTAGLTSMFSQQFGRDQETAAQSVTLSTVLSMLTLPLWAVIIELIL